MNLLIINILCIFICLAVITPLLMMGKYNYPSADDWSFGASTVQVINNGGNLWDVLCEAFDVAILWREKGEPRYANAFLGALQPGIWGEHFYSITPWIMLSSIVLSEIIFSFYLLQDKEGKNKKWILPIVIPTLTIQILCVPYPEETFYWYTGAVNYTFIFSLSLVLLTIFLKLKEGNCKKRTTALLMLTGSVIAIFVGGDSYAASLSSVCIFCSFSLWMIWKDKKAFLRTLPITAITTAGLLICLVAPGNQVRLQQEFGGTTTGAVNAVFMSLFRTASNIYSWTSLKIIIMVILVIPFLWIALKNVDFSFRFPLLFSIFTFGIYASQIVATMYVDGTTGGGRMADVLYYAYHVWILINVGYWIGWIQRKPFRIKEEIIAKLEPIISRHILKWFLVVGSVLFTVICILELQHLSTYKACAWMINGYAQEYAQAWENRLVILKDDSLKKVYFEPLPGYEELVFYADLQKGEDWVNKACADYYQKDYVGLK